MTQRQLAAHHEAGHAIAAYCFGRRIRGITIDSHGAGSTRCTMLSVDAREKLPDATWKIYAKQEYCIAVAGAIVEQQRFADMADRASWQADLLRARRWLQALNLDRYVMAPRLNQITRNLIERNWPAIRAVADLLMQHGVIRGHQVHELCRSLGVPRV